MYYALWIPSLTPGQPEVIERRVEKTLKDVAEYDSCRFISKVAPDTKDVRIAYSIVDGEPMRQLRLICEHRTHTGVIIYRLDDNGADDAVVTKLREGMHPAVYHLIKFHFHRHVYHDEECDTLLRPYDSTTPIDINNQSVMKGIYTFYLEQYRKKLDGSLRDLLFQYHKLREYEKKDWFWSSHTEAKRIKDECDRAVGEAAFARSLLTMSRATVRTNIYERITALTTELEILSRKSTDAYTVLNNRFNNRLGMLGLWVGAAGILLTLALEIRQCSGEQAAASHDSEYRELKQRADSLNHENRRLLDALDPGK